MYGFDDIPERGKGGYLRTPGIHMNGRLVSLTYTANENWEGFDIELETEDGKKFRHRTFGPNKDKVFPKDKWEDGKVIGKETNQEAFERVKKEIAEVLFHLAYCYLPNRNLLKEQISKVSTLKAFVEKVNSIISSCKDDVHINFATIWKNSEIKKRSNMILANNIRWCERTQYNDQGAVVPTTLALSDWHMAQCMVEKYKYNASSEEAVEENTGETDELPF